MNTRTSSVPLTASLGMTQEPTRNLNGRARKATAPPPDFLGEEESIRDEQNRLDAKRADLERQRKQAEAETLEEKQSARAALLDDIADWTEAAAITKNPDVATDLRRRIRAALSEAADLSRDLGLVVEKVATPTRSSGEMSTGHALYWLCGAFLLFTIVTYGVFWAKEENNGSVATLFQIGGPRMLFNIPATIGVFLFGIAMLRLFAPDQYKYLHNRVISEKNLTTDLNNATEWVRLLYHCFWLVFPVWVFVMLMQVIYT